MTKYKIIANENVFNDIKNKKFDIDMIARIAQNDMILTSGDLTEILDEVNNLRDSILDIIETFLSKAEAIE